MEAKAKFKLKFEYSRFVEDDDGDCKNDGAFYANCHVKQVSDTCILVWDIEPFQFQKPNWFPKALMVDVKNKKTDNKPIGIDQTLTYIDVFLCKQGFCISETWLFNLHKPNFRDILFHSPLTLLLKCQQNQTTRMT